MDDLFLDPVPHTWTTPAPHRSSDPGRSVDESSIDLYGDLSMSSIKSDQIKNPSSPQKHNRRHFSKIAEEVAAGQHSDKNLSKLTPSDSNQASDLDLYTDDLVIELSIKEKLEQLEKELNQVKTQNAQLLKNISSLFLTAKHEIQEKEAEIGKLRGMLEKQKVKMLQNIPKEDKVERIHSRSKHHSTRNDRSRDKASAERRSTTTHNGSSRDRGSSERHARTRHKPEIRTEYKEKSVPQLSDRRKDSQSTTALKTTQESGEKGQPINQSKDSSSYQRREDQKSKHCDISSSKKREDFPNNRNNHGSEQNRDVSQRNQNKSEQYNSENENNSQCRSITEINSKTEELRPNVGTVDATSSKENSSKKDNTSSKLNLAGESFGTNEVKIGKESQSVKKYFNSSQLTDLRQIIKKRKLEAERQLQADNGGETKRQKTFDLKRQSDDSNSCKESFSQHRDGLPPVGKSSPTEETRSCEFTPRDVIHVSNRCETVDMTQGESGGANNSTTGGTAAKIDMSNNSIHVSAPEHHSDKPEKREKLKSQSKAVSGPSLTEDVIKSFTGNTTHVQSGPAQSPEVKGSQAGSLTQVASDTQQQSDVQGCRPQNQTAANTETINSSKHTSDAIAVKPCDLKENHPENITLEPVHKTTKNNQRDVEVVANPPQTPTPAATTINITNDDPLAGIVTNQTKANLSTKIQVAKAQNTSENPCSSLSKTNDLLKVAMKDQTVPVTDTNLGGGQLFDSVAKSCGDELSQGFAHLGPEILNQESNSVASSISMPFRNVKSIDGNSVFNLTSTNQTWPFEASASTQNSINNCFVAKPNPNQHVYTLDESGQSSNSNFQISKSEKIQNQDAEDESGRSFHNKSSRAFPISSCEENVVKKISTSQEAHGPESEGNCGDSSSSLSSKNSHNSNSQSHSERDSASSASSGSSETNSVTTSKRADTPGTPQQNNVDPNTSSSQDSSGSHKVSGIERNLSGSSDTCGSGEHEKARSKLRLTKPDEMGIVCTSNLILLGDEETTCTTFASPNKSTLLPSEFYPPGVRGKLHEVGSHSRHIRGQSEVVFKPIRPLAHEENKGGRFKAIFEEKEEENGVNKGGRFKAIFEEEEKIISDNSSSTDSVIFVRESGLSHTDTAEKGNVAGPSTSSASHHGSNIYIHKPQCVEHSFHLPEINVHTLAINPDSDPQAGQQELDCFVISVDEGDGEVTPNNKLISKSMRKKKDIDCVEVSEDERVKDNALPKVQYKNNLKILRPGKDILASRCCCEHSLTNKQPQLTSVHSRDQTDDDVEDGDTDLEERPGFKAYLEIVQKALFTVKNQDLRTYKQNLIKETYSKRNVESQNEMRKELEKLQKEFHEFQKSSVAKSSLKRSNKQEDKVKTGLQSSKNLKSSEFQTMQTPGNRYLSKSSVNTQAQSSDSELPAHPVTYQHFVKSTDKSSVGQSRDSSSKQASNIKDKGKSIKHRSTAQTKDPEFKTDSSIIIQRNAQLDTFGSDVSRIMSSKIQALRSTAPSGWRASPESCVVTSSDCGKTASSVACQSGIDNTVQSACTADTQLPREPDSTSDDHSSSTSDKNIAQCGNNLVSVCDRDNKSLFAAQSEKSDKINHPKARLSKTSTPHVETAVSPFKMPRRVFNAPSIIDECSQFPSPIRPLSRSNTGNQGDKMETNGDPSGQGEEEDLHTTIVNSKPYQNDQAIFAFDEVSFGSHSLSEFDKDVPPGSSSPKPVGANKTLKSISPLSSSTPSSKSFAKILKTQKSIDKDSGESLTLVKQVVPAQLGDTFSVSRSNTNSVSPSNYFSSGNIVDSIDTSQQTGLALPVSSQCHMQKPQADKASGNLKDCDNLLSEVLSRHRTYNDLHNMRLVKTAYPYHEECSINVLESTVEENDKHFASPQLSKEEWQFLDNVKKVRKNLTSELEDSQNLIEDETQRKQMPPLSQSPSNSAANPCSRRTSPSEIFVESESEGCPSPVKKAKVLGFKKVQEKYGSQGQDTTHMINTSASLALRTQVSLNGSVNSDHEVEEDKTLVGDSEILLSPVKVASPKAEEPEEGEIEDDDDEEEEEKVKFPVSSAKDKRHPNFQSKSHFVKADRKLSQDFIKEARKKVKKMKRIRPVSHKNCETEQGILSPLERVYRLEMAGGAKYCSKKNSPIFTEEADSFVPSSSRADSELGERRIRSRTSRNLEKPDRHNLASVQTHFHSKDSEFALQSDSRDRGSKKTVESKRLETNIRPSDIRRNDRGVTGDNETDGRDLDFRNRGRGRKRARNYLDWDRPSSADSLDRIHRRSSLDQDCENKRDYREKEKTRPSGSSRDKPGSEESIDRSEKKRSHSRNSLQENPSSRRSYEEKSKSRDSHRERSNSRKFHRKSGSPRNS